MFKAHCDYEISISDSIMYTTMRGVWNVEGVQQYFEDIKLKAEFVRHQPWVRIADTLEFEGGAMELMDALKEIQAWSLSNNCRYLFLVAPKPMNKTILDMHQATYENMKYVYSMEEAVSQAKTILKEK
ncbi:hypothetical protein [Thalassotalea montiporae]